MKFLASTLLEKGYFCAELPPPFTSSQFAKEYKKLFTSAQLDTIGRTIVGTSECIYYSIPKAGYSRRNLGIPNPLHYSLLAESLEANSTQITRHLKSSISSSTPKKDSEGRRAFVTKDDFASFVRKRFLISKESSFELKIDISRYYSTIYTHIFAWALHNRDVAKKKRHVRNLLGNTLDYRVRALQSAQTMGIPIGPDASFILAELIGARLDKEISKRFPGIKSARYIDDFYFYLESRAKAEIVLKFAQSLLSEYLLSPNDEKTVIKEFPFNTDPEWKVTLRSLKATCFKDHAESEQESDIRQFFSAAFDCAEKNPKDEVMKFAAKTLHHGVKISDKNWTYYEAWLIKMGLYDPYTLPEITAILFQNSERLSRDSISAFVHEIINKHSLKRHSFEIAWALWLAKVLAVPINDECAEKLFDHNDVIPTLMAMDLRHSGLISKSVRVTGFKNDLTSDGLNDGRWILAYESFQKGWLKPTKANAAFVGTHPFFSVLSRAGISFYSETVLQPATTAKPKRIIRKAPGKAPVITKEEVDSADAAQYESGRSAFLDWLNSDGRYSL